MVVIFLVRLHFFGHIDWVYYLLDSNLSWGGKSRRESWSACLWKGGVFGSGELEAVGFNGMQELVC